MRGLEQHDDLLKHEGGCNSHSGNVTIKDNTISNDTKTYLFVNTSYDGVCTADGNKAYSSANKTKALKWVNNAKEISMLTSDPNKY